MGFRKLEKIYIKNRNEDFLEAEDLNHKSEYIKFWKKKYQNRR